MVLSGMSDMEQMLDNTSFMADFQPLNEKEMAAIRKVREIFRTKDMIPCTACRYCIDGCPQHISIPDLFAVMNTKQIHKNWTRTAATVRSTLLPAAERPTAWSAASAKRPALSTCPSGSC